MPQPRIYYRFMLVKYRLHTVLAEYRVRIVSATYRQQIAPAKYRITASSMRSEPGEWERSLRRPTRLDSINEPFLGYCLYVRTPGHYKLVRSTQVPSSLRVLRVGLLRPLPKLHPRLHVIDTLRGVLIYFRVVQSGLPGETPSRRI